MSDQGSMTFRLPTELQAAFVAACKASDMSAAQVLRGFMREYVAQRAQLALPLTGAKGNGKGGKK